MKVKALVSVATLIALFGLSFALPLTIASANTCTLAAGCTAAYFYASPGKLALGGSTNIVLDLQTIANGAVQPGTCNGVFESYTITQITVTTPLKDEYSLGSSSESGFTGAGGNAVPIVITTLNAPQKVPYGPESAAITILGNQYYWWRNQVAGKGTPAPGWRLDLVPGVSTGPFSNTNPAQAPAPSAESGMYTVDLSGTTQCSESGGALTVNLFFDIPFTVLTPEFPLGIGLVAAVGVAALFLTRKFRMNSLLTTPNI